MHWVCSLGMWYTVHIVHLVQSLSSDMYNTGYLHMFCMDMHANKRTHTYTRTHYVSVPMYLQNVHYHLRCSCPLHEAMMTLELSAIENDRDKQMAV